MYSRFWSLMLNMVWGAKIPAIVNIIQLLSCSVFVYAIGFAGVPIDHLEMDKVASTTSSLLAHASLGPNVSAPLLPDLDGPQYEY